jgi:hypothetical protein
LLLDTWVLRTGIYVSKWFPGIPRFLLRTMEMMWILYLRCAAYMYVPCNKNSLLLELYLHFMLPWLGSNSPAIY